MTRVFSVTACCLCIGHAVFKVHALLLRGTLYALWRMESEALRDLQTVINTQGQPREVRCFHNYAI